MTPTHRDPPSVVEGWCYLRDAVALACCELAVYVHSRLVHGHVDRPPHEVSQALVDLCDVADRLATGAHIDEDLAALSPQWTAFRDGLAAQTAALRTCATAPDVDSPRLLAVADSLELLVGMTDRFVGIMVAEAADEARRAIRADGARVVENAIISPD